MTRDDQHFLSLPESVVEIFRGQVGVQQDSRDGTPEFVSFKVVGVLGEGGMGTVYRAIQEYPQREVALKVMRPTLRAAPTAARFQREVEILAKLRHPSIAQLYTAGSMHGPGGSTPFLAMELVAGEPVTTHARRRSVADKLRLVVDICDAIAYAHGQGVIHRDLKPANILADDSGRVKVLDFGLAAMLAPEGCDLSISEAGALLGTPDYMSPEQADGLKCDERSDVFSIGVILYELLSGRRPLTISTQAAGDAARIIREDDPPRLRSICSSVHPDVEIIAGKAMAKARTARYASAAAMADDLRRFLANRPITARPSSRFYRARRALRRHRYAVSSGILIIASMAVGTALAMREASRAWHAQHNAQVQLAEAEVAQADMLVKMQDFTRARSRYEAAVATYVSAEVSPLPADLGLWELDLQSAHPVRTVDDVSNARSIAISRDGLHMATLDEGGQLVVSETVSGRVRWSELVDEKVFAIEFSSDGNALAVASKSSISIRQAADGVLIRNDQLPEAESGLVAGGNYFCVGCSESRLALVPAAGAGSIAIHTFAEIPDKFAFTRDGELYVITTGGQVLSAAGPQWKFVDVGTCPRSIGDQLVFAGGGTQVARVANNQIEFLDLQSHQFLHAITGGLVPVGPSIGNGAIFCSDRLVNTIDAVSSTGQVLLKIPSRNVSHVVEGGDLAVVASDGGKVSVWQARRPQMLRDIKVGEAPIAAADISGDGQMVALSTEKQVVMVRAQDGTVVSALPTGPNVTDVATDWAGSRVVTCTTEGVLAFWNAQHGEKERIIGDPAAHRAVLSPDGKMAISCCAGASAPKLWRRTGDTWTCDELNVPQAWFAEFNRTGTEALVAGDKSIEIWNVGKIPSQLLTIPRRGFAQAAHFLSDDTLVVLNPKGDIAMYSGHTGEIVATAESPSTKFRGIAVSEGVLFATDLAQELCVITDRGNLVRQMPILDGTEIRAASDGRLLMYGRLGRVQVANFSSAIVSKDFP